MAMRLRVGSGEKSYGIHQHQAMQLKAKHNLVIFFLRGNHFHEIWFSDGILCLRIQNHVQSLNIPQANKALRWELLSKNCLNLWLFNINVVLRCSNKYMCITICLRIVFWPGYYIIFLSGCDCRDFKLHKQLIKVLLHRSYTSDNGNFNPWPCTRIICMQVGRNLFNNIDFTIVCY